MDHSDQKVGIYSTALTRQHFVACAGVVPQLDALPAVALPVVGKEDSQRHCKYSTFLPWSLKHINCLFRENALERYVLLIFD